MMNYSYIKHLWNYNNNIHHHYLEIQNLAREIYNVIPDDHKFLYNIGEDNVNK